MSRPTTVDAADEIFERLALAGEVPPYLPVDGEVRSTEAWATDERSQRRDPTETRTC